MEKEQRHDLSKLHTLLEEKGIKHIYKEHPAAVAEPQAAQIVGLDAHPAGSHQIKVGKISIIRGFASFGMFELLGGKFDCDRFETEEEVVIALAPTQ